MRATEILRVDDNAADSDLAGEMLTRIWCPGSAHAVNEGVESTAFLQRAKYANAIAPDSVSLDLDLPRKDGHAVLAEVNTDPVLRKIPIAVFSASAERRDSISSVKSIGEFWLGFASLPHEERQ
jgi:two-component system, chemotaxis family, response regulator Rcp1